MLLLKFRVFALVAIIMCGALSSLVSAQTSSKTPTSSVVHGANNLGFQVLSELSKEKPGDSILISALSISQALEMTLNGAGGQTAQEMRQVLGIHDLSSQEINAQNHELISLFKALPAHDPKVSLTIANSLWADKGVSFNPDFIRINQKAYDASVREVLFRASSTVELINGWIFEKTQGKIPKLLEKGALNNAILVLINAVYFKGKWTTAFKKDLTKPSSFLLLDGASKTVPMMSQDGSFAYLQREDLQAIALPYGSGAISMIVLLPSKKVDFRQFIQRMTAGKFEEICAALQKRPGQIFLPRFKVKFGTTSLKKCLQELGMPIAFTGLANFLKMSRSASCISDVLHQTLMEVDEEGTVAAAATAVIMGKSFNEPFKMVVNHPFLVAIRDNKTGSLIFLGTIVNP